MHDALRIALAILALLALYVAVGTVERKGDPEEPENKPLSIAVPSLEEWCDDNPCACDDVGHKRLFVQAAD